jgi:flagellar protein FlaI
MPDIPANVHAYAARLVAKGRTPIVLDDAHKLQTEGMDDAIYPLGQGIFAHIHKARQGWTYRVIEPELDESAMLEVAKVRELVGKEAAKAGDHGREGTLRDALSGILAKVRKGVPDDAVADRVMRDMAGYGPIDPLLRDIHLEDIHVVGTTRVHVIHGMHGMMETNVRFHDALDLVRFLRIMGRPVSDSTPIVDAILPDGSRLNLVYSEDVSRRGPSLSLRRGNDTPLTITRLIQLNTISAEAAAYIWLCLEQGMSMFLCGEAACGKTATLNAILPFIDVKSKIYSAEDTPEVRPPHQIWQRLLTRETGPASGHVKMFDLLRAALRSRPDYIVVGEIRGAEGAVAFQAMQTGHATLATFHATDATTLVQRLGAAPILVPLTFMDNLNVALFQEARVVKGRRVRRVTKIVEIAGSSPEGVVAVPVFDYDRVDDSMHFQGMNNSHILEAKIAPLLGMDDTRKIYDRMFLRARILATMAQHNVIATEEVNAMLRAAGRKGAAALPWPLVEEVPA